MLFGWDTLEDGITAYILAISILLIMGYTFQDGTADLKAGIESGKNEELTDSSRRIVLCYRDGTADEDPLEMTITLDWSRKITLELDQQLRSERTNISAMS